MIEHIQSLITNIVERIGAQGAMYGVTTFLYDSFASLTNETVIGVAGTNTIERYWDEFGRTAGCALNGIRQTTICYEPDKGRISTMEIADNYSTTTTNHYNYFKWNYLDGSDLKSSLSYPNGLTASWTYDANNQLLQVCNAFPTNIISQYGYTYDAAGRRVEITRSGSAMSETRTDVYGYNIRNELISAAKSGGSLSPTTEYAYQSARGVPAHYEYAPFGAVTAATTNIAFTAFNAATTNPYRFSSEYSDDALGLVYYNYRYYEPVMGRWLSRDPKEIGLSNLYLFLQTPLFSFDYLGLETKSCCGPDVTLWALQEMMILERWISQVRDMIRVWSEKEAPWYEPNFVREKSYSYTFMLILGPKLTYFPDTDFSQGASCATSQDCANTVTFHGRCVHSSEIGNFIYGFVARMFRMTWLQTLGGAIYGNRGTRTTADSAAVEYGWDAADEGWWGDVKFPEDGSLAADMATDAPVQCKPSKCSTVVGHIALPPVTPTMNHTPINELKDSIVVPQTQK